MLLKRTFCFIYSFIFFYLHYFRFGLHSKWVGFIDVDEFLFIRKVPGQPVPSLTKFLANFSDVGGVMVDRLNFGPNGHKLRPSGLVIESYTKRRVIIIHYPRLLLVLSLYLHPLHYYPFFRLSFSLQSRTK